MVAVDDIADVQPLHRVSRSGRPARCQGTGRARWVSAPRSRCRGCWGWTEVACSRPQTRRPPPPGTLGAGGVITEVFMVLLKTAKSTWNTNTGSENDSTLRTSEPVEE